MVLVVAVVGCVLGAAALTAAVVTDHVRESATDEAVRSAESVVRGFVDPLMTDGALTDPTSLTGKAIDAQLEHLVDSGNLLRVKLWAPDGTVVYSDLPALRGKRFEVGEGLKEALDGEVVHEVSDGTAAENEFEQGLANRFLEVYLPVTGPDGKVVGAYEIYQDASVIEAHVAATRRDVFLIAGAIAVLLAALLIAAFDGTSRRLGRQNRQLRDLTDTLADSEARFRSLVQHASDLFVVVDRDGRILYESVAVERLLGYRPEDRAGTRFTDGVHPDDRDVFARHLASIAERPDGEIIGATRFLHRDGRWVAFDWTAHNLLDDPAVGGLVINAHDVTERTDLEAQLRHQSFHDPLTGLANRALFTDRVAHSLARRRHGHAMPAVLLIDLDDFKNVNDTLGHGSGDRFLVEVARRVSDTIRAGDTACRLSGDEFAVLLEEIGDIDHAGEIADRILEQLARPVDIGREVSVTASIGISMMDAEVDDADDLLARADVAMYAAKTAGKGCHQRYEPAMRARAWSRLELEGELRRAIAAGQIAVVYQPIVDLRSRLPVEMEALIRWEHPLRGRLAPADFISVAEESGLIVPLGRFVLEEACRQASTWPSKAGSRAIDLSVNLSSRQFRDPGLLETISSALVRADLSPANLKLEITESAMLDADASDLLMRRIRDLGVRIAVDDFGTGFSGLSYFQRFPLDTLKIDRSFVSGLGRDPRSGAIVHATIAFAKALGLTVTAEGIETEDQFERVRALGADLGQGYLFSTPLEASAVEAYLVGARKPKSRKASAA